MAKKHTSPHPMLDFVVQKLSENSGSWPAIARDSGVAYHTLTKIAYGRTSDPGVKKIEALNAYFKRQSAA